MEIKKFKGAEVEVKETLGKNTYRIKGKKYWCRSLAYVYITREENEDVTEDQRKMLDALRRSCRVE